MENLLEKKLDELIGQMTVEEKISLIPSECQDIERLGIKKYDTGAEGAHGFVDRRGKSTTFPQTIGLSSTWDKDLLKKIGAVIGKEARAYYNRGNKTGGLSLWFPTIDMERNPYWGRTEEAYGEDPLLAGELAANIIQGCQGDDDFYIQASCAPKHFFANNNEAFRDRCNCSVGHRNMMEYYLEPFRRAFKKGKPFSLMTSYNEVNGIPMMLSPLQNDLVKKQWGLEGRGHIVTDGGDVSQTVDIHHYFDRHSQTIAAAFKAGADTMTDLPSIVIPAVKEALDEGLISEEELNLHVKNILRVKARLGVLGKDFYKDFKDNPYSKIGEESMMSAEAKELSLLAAKESIVLLKNQGILPLDPKDKKKIALIGPLASHIYADWYTGNPSYEVTPLAGLEKIFGKENIAFDSGNDIVSLKDSSGKPLTLDKEGKLCVSCDSNGAEFERDDWGWGANTLYSKERKMYLQSVDDLPSDHQPSAEEMLVFEKSGGRGRVEATAPSTLNWFVSSLFNIIPCAKDKAYISSWKGQSLCMNNNYVETLPSHNPESFTIEVKSSGIERSKKIARESDIVFLFLGNNPVINGKEEVDRPSLDLPPHQKLLVESLAKENPNLVLVMVSGYPYTCKDEVEKSKAALWLSHGMQEEGNAIGEVLSGMYNPSGKLSMTWYKDKKDVAPIMDYDILKRGQTYRYFKGETLFPFGYGLSYTKFEYSNLEVDKDVLGKEDISVSFTVKNIGSVKGSEVCQLYGKLLNSPLKSPEKLLLAFERLTLESGEEKRVSLKINAEALKLFDVESQQFFIPKGLAYIFLGYSSEDVRLSKTLHIEGISIGARNPFEKKYAWNYDDYENIYLGEKRGLFEAAVFADKSEKESFVLYKNMDFKCGAKSFMAEVLSHGISQIELHLASAKGPLIGKKELPNTGSICSVPGKQLKPVWTKVEFNLEEVKGVQDLYIVLKGKCGIHNFEFTSL